MSLIRQLRDVQQGWTLLSQGKWIELNSTILQKNNKLDPIRLIRKTFFLFHRIDLSLINLPCLVQIFGFQKVSLRLVI